MFTYEFVGFFFVFIDLVMIMFLFINKEEKIKNLKLIFLLISVEIILLICMFPVPIDDITIQDIIKNNQELNNNFMPFKTIVSCILSVNEIHSFILVFRQIFGNILLFVPLGVAIFINNKSIKKRYVVILGLVVSLMVESFQFIFNMSLGVNYRSVDIDDMILNTLGCFMGYYCIKFFYENRNAFYEILSIVKNKKYNISS